MSAMIRSAGRLGAALLALGLCGAPAGAVDHAWLIGGGPDPAGSQAQIEFNVNWVREVLRSRPTPPRLYVYYTDGAGPGKDVKQWVRAPEDKTALTPLARVFDQLEPNGETFRDHRLGEVDGGTEAGSLKESLVRDFARLAPGDRALIVYNGHGLGAPDPADNYLRLWRNTRLTVREMDELLSRLDPSIPVRFVFTQCYSGGFARLIRPEARDVRHLGAANRCGFLAESETRESEGCSSGINVGDYRDYTTYFFAALDGRTRLGEPVRGNPDSDGDGQVSPYEAHLYVLRHAYNADLPRATSEVYLERWQPWYLRWVDPRVDPENVYQDIARALAHEQDLPERGSRQAQEAMARRSDIERRLRGIEKEKEAARERVKSLQRAIRKDLMLRWPELSYPYTRQFAEFLRSKIAATQDFILAHPDYGELVQQQERVTQLDAEFLQAERDASLVDKVLRLRKLARIKAQFERHASETEQAEYQRLLACETAPL